MEFYFCCKYIYVDGDEEVERDLYAALSYFQGFDVRMGMKSEKIILRISSGMSP